MGLMKIKTLVNVARMMITKGYTKEESHTFALTQLQFQFRAWRYERPTATSETRTREIQNNPRLFHFCNHQVYLHNR